MLKKNILLATILILSFIFQSPSVHASTWESLEIKEVLAPNKFLAAQRWRLRLIGIEIPAEKASTQCYQTQFNRFMAEAITNKPLKAQFEKHHFKRQLHRAAHIKFNKTHNLAEFLLSQGWAQTNNTEHKYQKQYKNAEALAQKNKKGVWGQCNTWHQLRESQRLKGKTIYFKPEHRSHLQATSTGWVKKVISPTQIELHNGLKIKLQSLSGPQKESSITQCWQKTLQPSLEDLLIGKKVHLYKDQLQLTNKGQFLQRYVWVEGNRWASPLFLNEHLLATGAAQLKIDDLNLKYVDTLKAAAKTGANLSTPPNWWQQCAQQVIEQKIQTSTESKLAYDEECPIKGNIAGSKKNPKLTYHTPLSSWYKRIEAEKCFKDEAEAETAGFTKVK